jgi:hypothetical protein
MKKTISKMLQRAAKLKSYFAFSGIYISMINFSLIIATFKATYDIDVSVFIIIPLGFLTILFIGFMDYNFVFYHQTKHVNKKNDIKIQLDRIEKQLEDMKNK